MGCILRSSLEDVKRAPPARAPSSSPPSAAGSPPLLAYFGRRERPFRPGVNTRFGLRERSATRNEFLLQTLLLVFPVKTASSHEFGGAARSERGDGDGRALQCSRGPISAFTLGRFERSRCGDLSVHGPPISALLSEVLVVSENRAFSDTTNGVLRQGASWGPWTPKRRIRRRALRARKSTVCARRQTLRRVHGEGRRAVRLALDL